jgi:hypothetical protein
LPAAGKRNKPAAGKRNKPAADKRNSPQGVIEKTKGVEKKCQMEKK